MSAQLSPMEYRERNESPSDITRDTYARTRSSLSKGEKKNGDAGARSEEIIMLAQRRGETSRIMAKSFIS